MCVSAGRGTHDAHTLSAGENKNQFIFAPKCLCIISRWNFDEFKTFLTELYRLSFASLDVPLERYIGNFMTEVPLRKSITSTFHRT